MQYASVGAGFADQEYDFSRGDFFVQRMNAKSGCGVVSELPFPMLVSLMPDVLRLVGLRLSKPPKYSAPLAPSSTYTPATYYD